MIWIYRILFLPAFIFAMPYYGWRMIKRGGYAKDFAHRFGRQKDLPPPAEGKTRVWIQAVSVGEVEAVAPLLEKLSSDSKIECVVTTTTSTGYKILQDKYAKYCLYTGVFPLDFMPFSRSAWNHLKADVAILMESELWPEHLHNAKARGAKLMLINARMSDRSFNRYLKIKFIAKKLLNLFDTIAVSTKFDLVRFLKLGADQGSTFWSGNLKFDSVPPKFLSSAERTALRAEMGFAKDSIVMLGSSTWPGEEEMLIETLKKLRSQNIDCRLLIAPRHAERRAQIIELIKDLPHCVRSIQKSAPSGTLIYLADTTGELRTLTQAADFAFIGKSLAPNDGGQTPIECACLNVAMVYGPNMTNFRRVCATLELEEAAIKVKSKAEAIEALCALAKDAKKRDTLAQKAKAWHTSNIGATQKTYDALKAIIAK